MDKRVIERLVPAVAHGIVLLASLHFIISMVYYRQMPRTAAALIIPNLLLLAWFWRRSAYIRDHIAQAVGWHGLLLCLGALPYISRLPALFNDRWLKPVPIGEYSSVFSPDYSLLVILVIVVAFVFPAAAVDGLFQAARRRIFQYPLIGRILPRPAFPDKDYIWHG